MKKVIKLLEILGKKLKQKCNIPEQLRLLLENQEQKKSPNSDFFFIVICNAYDIIMIV
jgi:hypothetical protein